MNGISSKSLQSLLGISPRQLHHWDVHGVVSPSIEAADGSGTRRRYSIADVELLMVVRELRAVSVGLNEIRMLLEAMRSAQVGSKANSATQVMWSRNGLVVDIDGRSPVATSGHSPSPVSIRINFGGMAAEVRKLLSSMAIRAEYVEEHTPSQSDAEAVNRIRNHSKVTVGTKNYSAKKDAVRSPIKTAKGSKSGRKRKQSSPTPSRPRAATWGESW